MSEIHPVKFVFPSLGIEATGVSTFQFQQDFATPSIASWSFTLEDNRAVKLAAAIEIGTKIQFQLDGHPQATGFVEKIGQAAGQLTVSGKDIMGNISSADLDFRTRFRKGMTLKQLLQFVLFPLGIEDISGDDSINQQAILGANPDDAPPAKTELGAIDIAQIKVKEGESVLTFIDRILARFGLYMWASATGGVVIGKPNYQSTPFHSFTRHIDKQTGSILDATLERSTEHQPSYFVSFGHGKGAGDEDHPRLKTYALNPFLGTDTNGNPLPAITKVLGAPNWKGIVETKLAGDLSSFRYLFGDNQTFPPRAVIAKDKNATTQKDLQEFARRRLGELIAKMVTIKVTVSGYAQAGIPFAVNRMVQVDDEVLNLRGSFFVKERNFTQSSDKKGTITQLTLCLPFCY